MADDYIHLVTNTLTLIKDRYFKFNSNVLTTKGYLVLSSVQLVLILLLIRWYVLRAAEIQGSTTVKESLKKKKLVNISYENDNEDDRRNDEKNGTIKVKIDPANQNQVNLSLLTSANCDLKIGVLRGEQVESVSELLKELAEISNGVLCSNQSIIPVEVLLLRLRAFIRGYQNSEHNPHVFKVTKSIITNPLFFKHVKENPLFVQDVAFYYGKELEQDSLQIIKQLIENYSSNESAILMFVVYTTDAGSLSRLLRFITQQLDTHRMRLIEFKNPALLFKMLLIICLKPELNNAHHVNIRHLLDRLLRSSNKTDSTRFILYHYSSQHPQYGKSIEKSLNLPAPTQQLFHHSF